MLQMCSVFIFLDINYCVFVFSKFNTWLCARGSALRLAIAPEFFYCSYARVFYVFTLVCSNKICMYVCMYVIT